MRPTHSGSGLRSTYRSLAAVNTHDSTRPSSWSVRWCPRHRNIGALPREPALLDPGRHAAHPASWLLRPSVSTTRALLPAPS